MARAGVSRVGDSGRVTRPRRLAVTLEQCWHAVPGGTAASALGTAAALAARDDVDPIGVSAWHRADPPDPWVPPIDVRPLRLPRLALYETWHRWRRPAVESATGPVDAIYATGVAVPPRTAPLLVTVHDLDFVDHPRRYTAKGRAFFRAALRVARQDADLVLCPSQATIDACIGAGFDAGRMRKVPWGVEARAVDSSTVDAVRGRFGLDQPYVLWTGTIEPRKNLPALVSAFRRLDRDDVLLVLAGPAGWNENAARLLAGIEDRVRVPGFVPGDDLAALYAGAAVFCYPSLVEGFGLPVLEAMAHGTPVVTSAGTATEEVVGAAGLVVDPDSVTAIADALARVLDDPAEASRLGVAGKERAREFTWAAAAAGVVEAADEIRGATR